MQIFIYLDLCFDYEQRTKSILNFYFRASLNGKENVLFVFATNKADPNSTLVLALLFIWNSFYLFKLHLSAVSVSFFSVSFGAAQIVLPLLVIRNAAASTVDIVLFWVKNGQHYLNCLRAAENFVDDVFYFFQLKSLWKYKDSRE